MNQPSKRGWHRFPELAYNPITFAGILLALFGLAAIAILTVLSLHEGHDNPYLGIFTLIIFPGVMILGLLLIPLGMLREKGRRERGVHRPFVVDFRNPAHRNAAFVFGFGTAIFLLITTLGLFETYQFTESVAFCGTTCHVMHPELAVYRTTVHSEVACVHCHVGPGTGGYMESKLAGARQLWHFARGDYHRPIPPPGDRLPVPAETCGHCHAVESNRPPVTRVFDHYLGDEENRHWQIRMIFDVGGPDGPSGASGSHWHLAPENRMETVKGDTTTEGFARVAWENGGKTVVYTPGGRPFDPARAAAGPEGGESTFGCFDCHNRPAHRYPTPLEAVNSALTQGELDRSVPFLKREAVRALSGRYETRAAAHRAIRDSLEATYRALGKPISDGAIGSVIAVYDGNFFPEMKADWSVYPRNDGHLLTRGCFRCHGSNLATPEGRTISAECNLCHQIYAQGFTGQPADTTLGQPFVHPFRHPIDVQNSEKTLLCTDCHNGDASLYRALARLEESGRH